MAPSSKMTSFRAALGPITSVILGPLTTFIAGLGIFVRLEGLLAFRDVAFFLAIGAIFLGRWVEHRGGHALTGFALLLRGLHLTA